MKTRVKAGGVASQKVSLRTTLILLAILAIPAFFWFRYLYNTYVADNVSPEMARMRDAMMRPHPMPGVHPSTKAKPIPQKKGDKKPAP
ncbi:MAG TPA: hypothetical protein VFB38_08535 [Chthonomonadaceae bacterium]|nr:hypothetical protein [Chthonomonadaceae bacterium]